MAMETDSIDYHFIYMNSPDPFLLMRYEDGVIIECNPAAEKALQGSKEQIIGLNYFDISPEYQPTPGNEKLSSVELGSRLIEEVTDKKYIRFEWTHQTLDGKDFLCDVNSYLTRLNQNEYCYLVIWRDITDYRAQQEELKQSKKRIEHQKNRLETINSDLRENLTLLEDRLKQTQEKYRRMVIDQSELTIRQSNLIQANMNLSETLKSRKSELKTLNEQIAFLTNLLNQESED